MGRFVTQCGPAFGSVCRQSSTMFPHSFINGLMALHTSEVSENVPNPGVFARNAAVH
jgi:hypothetical protein